MTRPLDGVTLIVLLSLFAILLVWEVVLLILRARGSRARTISMVARDYGSRMTFFVYLWSGLASHYWWNTAAWGSTWAGVTFWLIAVALLVTDIREAVSTKLNAPQPHWRHPLVWMVTGLLAGHFLFPQAMS